MSVCVRGVRCVATEPIQSLWSEFPSMETKKWLWQSLGERASELNASTVRSNMSQDYSNVLYSIYAMLHCRLHCRSVFHYSMPSVRRTHS